MSYNSFLKGLNIFNLDIPPKTVRSPPHLVGLQHFGVSGARIDTVSFGESKPAVQGHDESAWKWNRRVEFSAIR